MCVSSMAGLARRRPDRGALCQVGAPTDRCHRMPAAEHFPHGDALQSMPYGDRVS